MKEEFLHYLWRSKKFLSKELYTVKGEAVIIEDPGIYNVNQGPDFIYAKIKLEDVFWTGHLEMHVRSSDWDKHEHSKDPNYQNCILHVVWEYDKPVMINNSELPCVELKTFTEAKFIHTYNYLETQLDGIPCSALLEKVPPFILSNQLERSMLERLEQKTKKIQENLQSLRGNWEALLSQKILYYLTAPVNHEQAEKLCLLLPWKEIIKIKNDYHELESGIFGVAGLLKKTFGESYLINLQNTYDFLKTKYNWKEMNSFEWRYSRLRPAHFPDLRLAQWASYLHRSTFFFSTLLDCRSIQDLQRLFEFSLDPYWNHHYRLGDEIHVKGVRKTGIQTIEVLIINVAIPILFSYAELHYDERRKKFALELLEHIRPENNKYTRYWEQRMFACKNASQSQAMIQQMKNYCEPKKCLECQIGSYIISHV